MIDALASTLAERYELLRRVGQGGFGTVYEARDRSSGQRVALKELVAVNPLSLTHFKQEFRTMQEVHHRNLVRLDGLFEDQGKWVIAMELVEGTDLLDYLYVDSFECCFDEQTLRDAFGQLADGLQTLHAAGLVHRDLKPANVRVTREGRVVLLDFGLLARSDPESQQTRLTGFGTLSYMAPEQADRLKVGPAADWYAFGVCLYQALTGLLPVDGPNAVAKLLAKQQQHPPRASSQAGGVPEDLDELCDALLRIAPAERPSGNAVQRALRGEGSSLRPLSSGPTAIQPARGVAFEGRARELAVLRSALERSEGGAPQVVLVEGDSGIGKSALVEHFVAGATGALCLRSRCYESELLAYKAFDGAIGELAEHLGRLPQDVCEGLLPSRSALMCRLFPALEGVEAIARSPLLGIAADPALQRFEAFGVLARLLANLAVQRPVIFVIDDLQWADAESFALLQTLLATPALPCLVLATVRPRSELEGDAALGLAALRGLPCVRDLPLLGLPRDSAMALAHRLLGSEAPESWIDTIVDESAGHPLFLTVLTRFAGSRTASLDSAITLELALTSQLGELSRKARRLVETVAIAGVPLPAALCGLCAGIPENELGTLTTDLFRDKLLRRRQAGQIACFHDRIRHAAIACLSEAEQKALHGKLAATLAAHGHVDPAELARHYEAAGDAARACDAYRRGAERALSVLAFARAAMLYGRAGELAADPAQRLSLHIARGHALVRAGRSAEAAREYMKAAQAASGEERTRLRILSAQHLLQSACVEEGMAAAQALLSELDVPIPEGKTGILAHVAFHRAVVRLRGFDVVSAPDAISAHELMQLEALWGLAMPISWLDSLKAAAVTTRHLRLARRLREPAHLARALTEEAFARQFRDPHDSAIDGLLARAQRMAEHLGDPALEVRVAFREGTIATVRWELDKALSRLEHAHQVATERCPDQPWLLTNVRIALGPILLAMGEHAKLVTLTTAWLAEAHERNDQFALSLIDGLGAGYLRHLVADDPDRARESLRAALAPWPREPLSIAHFGEASAISAIELYRGGEAGQRWLARERPRFAKSFLMAMPFGKATQLGWSAFSAIAAQQGKPPGEASALRAEARARAVRLGKFGLRIAQLNSALLLAQLDLLDQREAPARAHAERGLSLAQQSGHQLAYNTLQNLLGTLEGGDTGAQKRKVARAFFAAQGWKVPGRAARMLCPALHGFGAEDE